MNVRDKMTKEETRWWMGWTFILKRSLVDVITVIIFLWVEHLNVNFFYKAKIRVQKHHMTALT